MERLGEQGYPTEEFLDYIKSYDFIHNNPSELFKMIEEVWWGGGWRHSDDTDFLGREVHKISISTWGWSGNEEIIEVMRQNILLWPLYWSKHERGGHFEFILPWEEEKKSPLMSI